MTAALSGNNYENIWWGLIYDQMMENLSEWVENNLHFYHSSLAGTQGPILECACGTGIYFMSLLKAGYDIYGFDISRSMLSALERKAKTQELGEILGRISVQDMETFQYNRQFESIIIPTNTFNMLVTQETQIRALKNIFSHLVPGGKLLLDLRLMGPRSLVEAPALNTGTWYTWTHPETSLPIRQRLDGSFDLNHQWMLDHCFIEYQGQNYDFPMTGRWTSKEEFQLLLRLAGFTRWDCFGTPDRSPLVIGLDDTTSYWIAYKD